MVNFVFLPTGKIFAVNGASMGMLLIHLLVLRNGSLIHPGTAGYGNDSWAIGQSYADDPVLTPAIYDPEAPSGQRWSRDGLGSSTVPRMYHSSATLLPDGEGFCVDVLGALSEDIS
jgi:hypothetical protein